MKLGLLPRSAIVSGCASLLLAVADARGEITHGVSEVRFGQGAVFGTMPIDLRIAFYNGTFDSRDDFENVDLFATSTFCPLCETCCCSWEIGSTRPFYRSKGGFDSADFSKTLELHDSSFFALMDTTRSGAIVNYPHTEYAREEGRFFVFMNFRREYVLMRIREVLKEDPIGPAARHQCENRIKVEWWIQGNGQAFFPAPTGLSRPAVKAGVRTFDDTFLINGSKIAVNPRKPARRLHGSRGPAASPCLAR